MKSLHGSWILENFEIEKPDGSKKPWGESMSGLLIYSPDGHMSVSINRKANSEDPNDVLNSVLFYSGTYNVSENSIKHQVKNATSLSRIGKEIMRYYKFDDDLLHLYTAKQSFGVAHLTWKKVK